MVMKTRPPIKFTIVGFILGSADIKAGSTMGFVFAKNLPPFPLTEQIWYTRPPPPLDSVISYLCWLFHDLWDFLPLSTYFENRMKFLNALSTDCSTVQDNYFLVAVWAYGKRRWLSHEPRTEFLGLAYLFNFNSFAIYSKSPKNN